MPSSAQPRAAVRRARERRIVEATRALFDERGVQDARIDRIARRAGINKALIYRHFPSKEDLFALTTTGYLTEIHALLAAVDAEAGGAVERLHRAMEVLADYAIEHPAFLDGALTLFRQPADELEEQLSDAAWLQLSRTTGACIGWLADVLGELGAAAPDLAANQLYLQAIGVLHLARSGAGLRQVAPGLAVRFAISAEQVRAACVQLGLAAVAAAGTA